MFYYSRPSIDRLFESDVSTLFRTQSYTTLDRTSILTLTKALLPPIGLMLAVLGSIFMGIATPAEASGIGALGAFRFVDRRVIPRTGHMVAYN